MTYDKNFLLKLDQHRNKIIYAKIIALTFNEYPIETIEGRVTQGSISLDGSSAVRRTCSLTIIAQNFDYQNYYWGLNTKFKLEIGVKNDVDINYPEIIWFNQGIYLISSFNTSRSTSNFTITIQGKDKMSMLNGEVGGTINSSVDFGSIEEEDQNGNWVIRKIPIREIITNMVHQYAGEPLHNIIINDLPDYGLELLEYRYDVPMYLYKTKYQYKNNKLVLGEDGKPILNSRYDNTTLDEGILCSVDGKPNIKRFSDLTSLELDMLVDPFTGVEEPAAIKIATDIEKDREWIVAKVEYGQTAGYRQTPLTYAGDLIANVGETIVSVLDKIKNMLGEFEYFYDLDGHFVFQQKQSFINTLYSPKQLDGQVDNLVTQNAISYVFNGGELITSFNNNPNLSEIRNDFSIWGERTSISGVKIPVHLRYAIDKKPTYYKQVWTEREEDENIKNYNEKNNTTLSGRKNDENLKIFSITPPAEEVGNMFLTVDWREIIYQMALDYYKYGHLDNFELMVRRANPDYYPTGKTGYEQYYIDIQDFWRQLYNPNIEEQIKDLTNSIDSLTQIKNSAENDYQVAINNNKPLSEVEAYKLSLETAEQNLSNAEKKLENLQKDKENYYYDTESDKLYWNKSVYEKPEALNFWFDFLDTEGLLSSFGVKSIGVRPKAINDTNIQSIYFRETPNILFVEDISNEDAKNTEYTYIQVPGILKMFSISSQGKSAKSKLDEFLYNYGYYPQSATINCIPIYYLQPNTRIHINDKETNLIGDFIISKITIPLSYNGTMSLTATRAAEDLSIELIASSAVDNI